MSELQLVTVPDPLLRQRCEMVETWVPETWLATVQLGKQMLSKMEESNGVGLAAPQIGLLRQVFVASTTGKAEDGTVFINPMFHEVSADEFQAADEGCLSIPGALLPIKRFAKVSISYVGLDFELHFLENVTGLFSRIIQHEMDHLYGILITDRYKDQQDNGCTDSLCC